MSSATGASATVPEVSVVVPYYEDQSTLTLLLRALDQQTGGHRYEVVVADDGSPEAPTIPAGLGFPCTVVRQQDLGFRAAAARNLGAAAATGELLLFLDGDTLPTSDYLASMVRALRDTGTGHGALVVGRRRYLDLAGVDDPTVLSLLAGASPAAAGVSPLPEPTWLTDGYARTQNLQHSGDEDFRLVISAVLGMDRVAWQACGGFDESFVGYGGEDWDLAWRSWIAGADRRYVPEAIAWHDGPDAGGRAPDPLAKNIESVRLARSVPLPSTRGSGLWHEVPQIAVTYRGPVTGTASDAAVIATVAGLLEGSDAAVWFPDVTRRAALPPLLAEDPRVHPGGIPASVTARARYRVEVLGPAQLPTTLEKACTAGEVLVPGLLQIRHARSIARGTPIVPADAPVTETPAARPIPEDVSLERWWAGW